jgi:hypothetical protein
MKSVARHGHTFLELALLNLLALRFELDGLPVE